MTVPTRPERIDLAQADDPRDVVHQAVASLAQGGAVGFPAAGGMVAACALAPDAIARARAFARPDPSRRPAILMRGPDELADWAANPSETARRLARRGWPGPLTLVVDADGSGLIRHLPGPVRDILAPDGRLALHVPTPGPLLDAVQLVPAPVVAFEVPPASGTAPFDQSRPGVDGLDMVIESASFGEEFPAAVVRLDAASWAVEREGAITKDEVAALAGTVWLFVCTGNTCRSPMAEALCKGLLAKKIGCKPDALLGRGYVVMSAGVGAGDGMPAASHAVDVVARRGGSLKAHASRRATAELLRRSDLILALALDHLDAILDLAPDVADRARLLHPEGDDVVDPIGSDRAMYEDTAREIEAHLARLIDEMGVGRAR